MSIYAGGGGKADHPTLGPQAGGPVFPHQPRGQEPPAPGGRGRHQRFARFVREFFFLQYRQILRFVRFDYFYHQDERFSILMISVRVEIYLDIQN